MTNYTCSISINSNQLFVGIVDVSASYFSCYCFEINPDSIVLVGRVNYEMIGDLNVNTIFRCMAEGNDKVLCIMLDEMNVFFFEVNFRERTIRGPFFLIILSENEQVRITQCGENSYIIAVIEYYAQYFTLKIVMVVLKLDFQKRYWKIFQMEFQHIVEL